MQPVRLYGVPFSQPVRAVMWLMLYKQTPFELVLINPAPRARPAAGIRITWRRIPAAPSP